MNRVLRFVLDWPLFFYNLILILVAPVVLLLKAVRYFRKGWKREYDMGRWFIPTAKGEVSTPRVVLVGTGWGEMRLIALLDSALKKQNSGMETIWVLRDRDAIIHLKKTQPNQAVTWLPFDFFIPVWFWLWKLQPDIVVFTEKFWFPNLVRGCKNFGAKMMVMNARTRKHESARYKIFSLWQRHIASSFDAMVFQSETDEARMRGVLQPRTNISAPGNLKFALRPAPDESKTQSLREWLDVGSTPLLTAGSLEDGDLNFVLDAFEITREKNPCCLLIAPRRLHLVDAMRAEIEARGYKCSLRSQRSTPVADVYLLDSMGELANAYQLVKAAFIGGTLKYGAGHNVVEPLIFGVPVSYGPNRGFFESVQVACEEAGVGFRVRTSEELALHWVGVLHDATFRQDVKACAAKLLAEQSGALEANVEVLLQLVHSAQRQD